MSDLVAEIGGRLSLLKFSGPAFERTVFRFPAACVVDDGVAQNRIEPRDDRAAITHGIGALERADVGALQDVLCERAVLHATLHKPQKGRVMTEQGTQSFTRGGGV